MVETDDSDGRDASLLGGLFERWKGNLDRPIGRLVSAMIDLMLSAREKSREQAGERWNPVGQAARDLGSTVTELLVKVTFAEGDDAIAFSSEALETLDRYVGQLFAALPMLAEEAVDDEDIDEELGGDLEDIGAEAVVGSWETLSDVFDFVASVVDTLVERVVERALDPEVARFEPERVERVLGVLDRLVSEVLERWLAARTDGS